MTGSFQSVREVSKHRVRTEKRNSLEHLLRKENEYLRPRPRSSHFASENGRVSRRPSQIKSGSNGNLIIVQLTDRCYSYIFHNDIITVGEFHSWERFIC